MDCKSYVGYQVVSHVCVMQDYGMTVRKKRRSRSVTADMADGDLQGGEAAASVLKGQLHLSRQQTSCMCISHR